MSLHIYDIGYGQEIGSRKYQEDRLAIRNDFQLSNKNELKNRGAPTSTHPAHAAPDTQPPSRVPSIDSTYQRGEPANQYDVIEALSRMNVRDERATDDGEDSVNTDAPQVFAKHRRERDAPLGYFESALPLQPPLNVNGDSLDPSYESSSVVGQESELRKVKEEDELSKRPSHSRHRSLSVDYARAAKREENVGGSGGLMHLDKTRFRRHRCMTMGVDNHLWNDQRFAYFGIYGKVECVSDHATEV
jgi:hypothetical protein